jgi:hypothetical protein
MFFLLFDSLSQLPKLIYGAIYHAPCFLPLAGVYFRCGPRHPATGPVRDRHNHFQIVQQLGGWLWGRIGLRLASRLQK